MGLSKAGPLIARGWSAEAPPTIAPYRLRATSVEAATAELTWEWPPETSGAVNGFFIGLRIEWCLAERDQICDRYKVIQVCRRLLGLDNTKSIYEPLELLVLH